MRAREVSVSLPSSPSHERGRDQEGRKAFPALPGETHCSKPLECCCFRGGHRAPPPLSLERTSRSINHSLLPTSLPLGVKVEEGLLSPFCPLLCVQIGACLHPSTHLCGRSRRPWAAATCPRCRTAPPGSGWPRCGAAAAAEKRTPARCRRPPLWRCRAAPPRPSLRTKAFQSRLVVPAGEEESRISE